MATILSNLLQKKHRHRGIYSGQDYDVAGRIFLPKDTVLDDDPVDDLLFVPVGENQVITKVTLLVLGDTSTIAGSIGYFQMLDENGAPVVVRRNGPSIYAPNDSDFTSPATSAAAYRTAGQLDGYTETIIAAPAKLAGPVNVGIRITTGGTIAADTEMFLAVYFDGETNPLTIDSGYPNGDQSYLLG